MSKAAQLKKKASEFEQKKQYDRALAMYIQAIEAAAGLPDEIDIPLYNRVGDLYLRLGDLEQAVAYYEMAVDLYAEGGFFNNAIALCNKILRHSPSRSSIYYKLGKISASKGFNSDAKQNFLEYADRMQKEGDPDEAFRALKEFADLCPGQDDVRLMLADQLAKASRKDEALEQLQIVHDTMVAESRTTEAAATLERMRALDPAAEPRQGRAQPQEKRDGLVFIDVNYEAPPEDVVAMGQDLDFTIAEEALAEGRPLTASEFGEVDLPESHDVHIHGTLDASPLSGLEPHHDPLSALAASLPMDPVEPFDLTGVPETSDVFVIGEPSILSADAAEALANNLDDPFGHDAPEVDYNALGHVPSILEGEELPPSSPDGTPVVESQSILEPEPERPSFAADMAIDSHSLLEPEPPPPTFEQTLNAPEDVPVVPPPGDDDFVDLQKWLEETEPPKNPRMTAEGEESEGEGEVQTDFSDMLETFKRGVANNVDDSDSDSHYDLGVAYMEMGLTDDAIAQFQRVIRGDATPDRRMRAYESLGQCFIERHQYAVAATALSHALQEPRLSDDKLIGVLFLLGYTAEMQHQWKDAVTYYQRVFAADIHFRDVSERLAQVRRHAQGSA